MTNIEYEREVFWDMFEESLISNGNPFKIATKRQFGTVNQNSPVSNLCLGFDFLLQKRFFRINIYIENDNRTPHFDRLMKHKEEIEAILGFKPIWTVKDHTRRIEVQLPFKPYDREDYARLLDEALPIFMNYIVVCKKYLPEVLN